MSGAAIDIMEFVKITCGECGVTYAMNPSFCKMRMNDHKAFYCPNGHTRVFVNETEADRLKKELLKEKQLRAWADERTDIARQEAITQNHRARAYKGKYAHIKKRVANGICPCCNRSFQNLMSHMKIKHPKYKDTK